MMKRVLVIAGFAAMACLVSCRKAAPVEPEKKVVVGTAVDLGLSVKWADHNVGAVNPEDFGDYFAWGETAPKAEYTWETYTLCDGAWNTINKYNNEEYYGKLDNKTQLEKEDDAASVNWGGKWRMPTKVEMEELRTKCAWKLTSMNGVSGYEVSSKTNGNSIFIPVAGHRNTDKFFPPGCYYWTSSLQLDNAGFAHRLYHSVDGTNTNTHYRFHGMPVRPCCND